jgi:hypothetical protein
VSRSGRREGCPGGRLENPVTSYRQLVDALLREAGDGPGAKQESSGESGAHTTTADYQPSTATETEATPAAASTAQDTAETTSGDRAPHDADVDFRSRWEAIRYGFVDDPRNAVEDASILVGEVIENLAATLEQHRRQLEGQWSDGAPDTEQLRSALRQYRDLFNRLLTI